MAVAIADSFLLTRLMSTGSVADLVTIHGFSKAEDHARDKVSNTLYKNEPTAWVVGEFSIGFINSPNARRVDFSFVHVNHARVKKCSRCKKRASNPTSCKINGFDFQLNANSVHINR